MCEQIVSGLIIWGGDVYVILGKIVWVYFRSILFIIDPKILLGKKVDPKFWLKILTQNGGKLNYILANIE